eukprot:CAMPEP_0118932066 /NCGR_PEP_ID=MMETSP1169-20130426/8991_1 /TAXON_ID=36882 /ORGANISM="Pyramimonas obovata, Strain CCMP722" /LENGTH=143 /DNA_ID=CAMNT_0006874661 /DNA_START=984 /DNA_END=1416 /DNA_ORIENTATION=+
MAMLSRTSCCTRARKYSHDGVELLWVYSFKNPLVALVAKGKRLQGGIAPGLNRESLPVAPLSMGSVSPAVPLLSVCATSPVCMRAAVPESACCQSTAAIMYALCAWLAPGYACCESTPPGWEATGSVTASSITRSHPVGCAQT